MSKFKVGDRVRYTGSMYWKDDWQDCVITAVDEFDVHVDSLSLKKKGELYIRSIDIDFIELIPPSGFEIGKRYKPKKGNAILEIVGVTNTHLWYKNVNTGIHVTNPLNYDFVKTLEEIISPPPEEWRAVFYVKNGKPEISANYWSSKKEVEDSESGKCYEFMYAIRTDEGVLKNG